MWRSQTVLFDVASNIDRIDDSLTRSLEEGRMNGSDSFCWLDETILMYIYIYINKFIHPKSTYVRRILILHKFFLCCMHRTVVPSVGSRRTDQHSSLLAMLLSQHRCNYFCGRQCRFGANAGCKGGTSRHVGRGRIEGIYFAGLCQQAGSKGCHECATNQRRSRATRNQKSTMVYTGNVCIEGKGPL